MKIKINLPGFNASLSYSTSTLNTDKAGSFFQTVKSFVIPQALASRGGFGGFGGRLGIDPLPPSCTECNYECTITSCGPNCRRERCEDVCTSVPCFF